MSPLSPEELDVVVFALRVAGLVVAVSLVPGVLVGWLLARWRSRWRIAVQGVVMLPLVLPPVVTGYVLLEALGRETYAGRVWHAVSGSHPSYSATACVIAAAVVGFPLLVESVRLAIVGVDERLELVSRSLGRGRLSTFVRVTLPLALPGVLTGAVLAFARALGEYGATVVLAGNTAGETRQIPLAVAALLNAPGNTAAVTRLVVVSIALSLLALVIAVRLGMGQRRRGVLR